TSARKSSPGRSSSIGRAAPSPWSRSRSRSSARSSRSCTTTSAGCSPGPLASRGGGHDTHSRPEPYRRGDEGNGEGAAAAADPRGPRRRLPRQHQDELRPAGGRDRRASACRARGEGGRPSPEVERLDARTARDARGAGEGVRRDRKSTRLNSSHDQISYAVFCLKKKKNTPR